MGFGEKFLSEARYRSLERPVAAQIYDDFVELRRGVTIALVGDIRTPENQIDRDAHQRCVSCEPRDSVHFLFEGRSEVGREEASASDILAHVMGEIAVAASRDQTMPHDDMGR